MSAAALVPLAMFLLNESTRELYVLPAEAAAKFEGVKPCVSIRNTISQPVFYSNTLDQMCAYLAQQTLPRLSASLKTTWSSDHGAKVGMTLRNLIERGSARENAPIWPPALPFSVAGLTGQNGVVALFGVKAIEQQPAMLERVDIWAQQQARFNRTYWSRAMHDPTRFLDTGKVMRKVGVQIRRTWSAEGSELGMGAGLRILVDKRISERELTILENVVKQFSKSTSGVLLKPVAVQKEGIVYQSGAQLEKVQEFQDRLSREMSGFKIESVAGGSADLNIKLLGSR